MKENIIHMNKIIYILILFSLFWGCEKNEVVIPTEENSKLTINWEHPYYGNSSWKDNAMIYLYDSEEEYSSPIGNFVLSESVADIYPEHGGTITPVNSASFNNLEPIKYWVRIFNAYNHEKLVEYNTDSACTFQYPLIENTYTTVTIPTKRIYVNSYTIEKIEIYDIPSWLDITNGDQVTSKIFENFPSSFGSEQDKVLDSKTVTMNNSSIIYEPTNVVINRFNSWWFDPDYYVILNKSGSLSEEYYEINIFELLNSNAHFGNEYIKLNTQNEIKYKLYVTWDIE